MQRLTQLCSLLGCVALLSACQSTPSAYNGTTGYQIENKTEHTATLVYTLAGRANQDIDAQKLQRACQKTLSPTKNYKISILSNNEIQNPTASDAQYGMQIGQSRASFGFSNTPSLNNSENYASRQSLEARPSTLRVVRYTCE